VLTPGVSALTLQYRLGGYREYTAPPELAPVCEAVWLHRTPPDCHEGMHRVLPDPAMSIVFTCCRQDDGRPSDARMLVVGPKTRPHVFAFEPGREMVAVKIKLEWTTSLVGLCATDHEDTVIDLHEVDAALADAIEASLAKTLTIEAAVPSLIATMTQHATRRVARAPGVAARALDYVRRSHGRRPIRHVADWLTVSERYLRRVVERDAGVSLKAYARTVRLLHAVTMADACRTQRLSWATIAGDAGFSDQAHLIRECQALCGLTPGAVWRERRTESGYCPVLTRDN